MGERMRLFTVVLTGFVLTGGLSTYLAMHPPLAPQTQSARGQDIVLPTIEQMCAALGAGEGDVLKQCQADEAAAGEYVVAWMGLNGFLSNGAIDVGQIQFMSELDESDP